MKNLIFTLLFLVFSVSISIGQEVTITEPSGLTPPFEVDPGTEISVQWEYDGIEPMHFFTYDEEPELNQFELNDDWEVHNDFADNGDGTYSYTFTVSEEVYVWAANYQSFLGRWNYSNVLHINIATGVKIFHDDGLLCPDSSDTETLIVQDTFEAYQWYRNGDPIPDATINQYLANQEGLYKVLVDYDGEQLFSNTLSIQNANLTISGSYDQQNDSLTINSDQSYTNYQWLSGTEKNSLQAISGETSDSLIVSIPSHTEYYAVQTEIGDCIIQSDPRKISQESFAEPQLIVHADTNSFGEVCEGTEIVLSTDTIYESYDWYRGTSEVFNDGPSLSINSQFQTGSYRVVTHPEDWPYVEITSDEKEVSYFEVIEPTLTGVNTADYFCPGEMITVILGDEGYDYTWYLHEGSTYDTTDIIEVENNTLKFEFEGEVSITVEASYRRCNSSETIRLRSYNSLSLNTRLENYDDQYLCEDSTALIYVPSYLIEDYSSFQWYEVESNDTIELIDETSAELIVDQAGKYLVKGIVNYCPSIEITSRSQEINGFEERPLMIYADSLELCEEDSTLLNVNGGTNWQDFQWFEDDIAITGNGYEKFLIPLVGAGNSEKQAVTEFNGYAVKARHNSCPTGPKITSNKIQIKPKINPNIVPSPNYGIEKWHTAFYDSIANYLYCEGQDVTLSLDQEYDDIEWYSLLYAGDDDYELGEKLPQEGDSITIEATNAFWYTAKVTKDNCTGFSDPVVIDTKVYLTPAIASYNNAELCEQGDSTLLHIGFQNTFGEFEWYRNGELIPNSNNDTLWAHLPGEYTVTAFPEDCPDKGFSSGVGPVVKYLEASIEENDTAIYALPQLGIYEYQWYKDGEPIDGDPLPWVLRKENLEDGTYTVEVTNPEPCTAVSGKFHWNTTSIDRIVSKSVLIYPNPASKNISVELTSNDIIVNLKLINGVGQTVKMLNNTRTMDVSEIEGGLYIIRGQTADNRFFREKIIIQK